MSDFRLPGVVWSVLMIALPLLAAWMQEYLGVFAWTPAVAGLLLLIARVIASVRPSVELPAGVARDAHRSTSIWW